MPSPSIRGAKLPLSAYRRPNPVERARFFLGKQLVVRSPEGLCSGLITETEAYGGNEDLACHGAGNRRTARTQMLFEPGGRAYVYLCYGIHSMLNFVIGPGDIPLAILIRAVHITAGQDLVKKRRPRAPKKGWTSGPGRICAALAITLADNGCDLTGNRIWVEDIGIRIHSSEITATPRIGVDYAGEWAAKPWRFVWGISKKTGNAIAPTLNCDRGDAP